MGALEEKLASVQLVAHVTLHQKTTVLIKRRTYISYKEKKGDKI